MRPEVVYYGKQVRSSLQWLAVALFLGGSPLAVYFASPQPGLSQQVLALVLGVPLFALCLVDLGKSKGVILNPASRQLKYVEGFFSRREAQVYSYDEVRGVYLRTGRYSTSKGVSENCLYLHLDVGRNRIIVLQEWSWPEAKRRARYLAAAFGVEPRLDDDPLRVEIETAPRPGTDQRFYTYLVCYGLGALILVLAFLYGMLRYAMR